MIHYYLQRHWRAYENGLGYGTFLGRINHYALRSLESYFVKWQRGFVHPNAPTVRGKGTIEDYWKLFNWNDYMEIRSLPLQAASASIKSALLSIENIQSIYDKSFEWHQTRAHTLISDNQEIYERLKNSQSTKIDDVLPDFSHHGSPKTLDQPYIPKQLLQHKARQTSIFSHDMINKHYEVLT